MGLSNKSNLPLPIAVFLASDSYAHDDDVVSVTKFIKPVRELILSMRVSEKDVLLMEADVLDMYKSRVGTAIHGGIERVWLDDLAREAALTALDVPAKVRKAIKVNPDPKTLKKGDIPVYVEKTFFKEIDGYMFRGTADIIFNGRLGDFKKTSPLSYTDVAKNRKYSLQGSLYAYMSDGVVTEDSMDIYEMYEEWNRFKATSVDYPPAQVVAKDIPLMSHKETEKFILNKIKLIEDLIDAPDEDIPLCTDEDLWRRPPVFKYYKNPEKTDRSTANFSTYADALDRKAADGYVGNIVEVKSKAVACNYCSARPVCGQAKALAAAGELN